MSYIMRSALGSICAFARRKPLLFALLVISSWAMIYFMLHYKRLCLRYKRV